MIYTITLNPCVDMTVICDNFVVGALNFAPPPRFDPVGKGINVSRMLKVLGMESTALGFAFGQSGRDIMGDLEKRGIPQRFLWYPTGETRTNIKIMDSISGSQTEINQLGPIVTQEAFNQFLSTLDKLVKRGDFVVISGRMPPGLAGNTYGKLISHLQNNGAKVVLDASGIPLVEGAKALPFMLKPNIHELGHILKFDKSDLQQVKAAAQTLVDSGVEMVLVSMGEAGSIFVSKDYSYHMPVISVKVDSTMGAGDSVVGGFLYGLTSGMTLEGSLKLSQGCGAAMVTTEGTQPPDKNLVYSLADRAQVVSF